MKEATQRLPAELVESASMTEAEQLMGTQLYLPARWASALQSLAGPADRLAALEHDVGDTRARIRELLDELAGKHGVPAYDVTFAMRSVDDALSDLLYDIRSGYERDLEVVSEP